MLGTFAALLTLGGMAAIPSQLEGVHRIVMMGDSITQLGASPKGYVTLISNTLKSDFPSQPIEVINAGISGHRSNDMLARFQHDVLDQKPDLATINVGVNDVWHNFRTPDWSARVPAGNSGRGVSLDAYLANVGKMIDMARAAGVRVWLVSPTLVYEDLDCAENRRLRQYAQAEKRLASEKGVGFVDLNSLFRATVAAYRKGAGQTQLLLTVDGVHMNDQGNALMAGGILKALGVPIPDTISPK